MAILRTIVCALSIYLVLMALSPRYVAKLILPAARATEPLQCKSLTGRRVQPSVELPPAALSRRAAQYMRQGKSKEALADLDVLITSSPTWSNYLRRALAQLFVAQSAAINAPRSDNNLQSKIALVINDCKCSLSLQKSPDCYRLLTRANLIAGTGQYKDACLASMNLLKASPNSASALQLQVLAAFMAGDFATARQAVVSYASNETKMGHAETGHFAGGLMGGLSPAELQIIISHRPLSAPRGEVLGGKILQKGVLDFLNHRYDMVKSVDVAYKEAEAKNSTKKEEMFALTLAAAANLLCRQPQAAQAKVAVLMQQKSPDLTTLTLLDDVFFDLAKREQGLKEIAASSSDVACVLARAKILDEMSQPQEALKVLQGWMDKNKSKKVDDDQIVLQIARLSSNLNKNAEALEQLRLYMAKHAKSGEAYFLRAQIYAQKGQFSSALSDLDVAIDDGYNLLKAVRARAACYEALAQKGPARDDMNLAGAFNRIVP